MGVWNGFLLGKAKKENVPCRFCGIMDGDGHLFWEWLKDSDLVALVQCMIRT